MGKEIFSQCRLTVSEEIKPKDIIRLFQAVRKIGFKISQTSSLIIEKDSTSSEELIELVNLLISLHKSQEHCSTSITGAGTETCNKSRKQENGAFGHTAEQRSSANNINLPESVAEDCVLQKHHFHLASRYFKDQDWKELFDKAEETNEGFRFRAKDILADDYFLLQILKETTFETFDIPDDEAYKVKEAAKYINCVDHGVRVIDYNSRPYLVGPKVQVHAAKEEILYQLEKRGVHCQGTSTKTLYMNDDLNGDNFDAPDKRQKSQPQTRDDTDMFLRYKNSDVLRRPHETNLGDSKNRKNDTGESSALGKYWSTSEKGLDPGVYTGHYSEIRVHIHKADITRLDVDCIVNAANTKLRHGGGVARVIATTAGKELQEACERFIAAGNSVPVTRVFVSPGGRLPAKHVFHAVGPIWDKYTDKNECTDDLKRTVLRCLVEAMRLRLSSIALPSISAAIFKVPKKLCAHSYMEAVRSFDAMFGQEKDCTLKEIHFVDVDDVMVKHIQESFMRHWGEPWDSAMERSLPPKRGAPSASQNSRKPASPENHTKRLVSYSALQAKPSGAGSQTFEVETEYQIGRIRLCISNKPALSFDTDPIITIGREFDKLSGTENYKIKPNLMQCIEHHSQRNAFDFTYLCKPDGKQQRLLCRLYPDPKSPDDIKSAVGKLDAALRMASVKGTVQRNVTSFVLTSSILYAEPNNKKQEEPSKSIVPKLVGSLALNVCEYLYAASQDRSSSLNRVVITASKDAIPYLCEVFESSDFVKKVWKSTVV